MDHPQEKQSSIAIEHPVDTVYETVMDRTVLRTLGTAPWIAAQKNAAPARLSELLTLPPHEREKAIATEPRFQTYALANYILEKGEEAIPYDPSIALDLARLSRAVTVRIDPRTCGGLLALTDLGAYALAWEANAQRVCGNLVAAIATFDRARQVEERGSGDPDITSRINLLEASLRRDIGQPRTALNLLDRASEDLLSLREDDLWITAQVSRSNVFQVREQFDKAAMILEDSLARTRKPHMLLNIRHNLAYLFAKTGQAREAAVLINESRELYRQFSAPLLTNRRLWLEGIIACELGEDEQAGRLLEDVGFDLEERGYGMDAALIRNELERVRGRSAGQPPPRD